ncbi:MAG: hypothetical protein OEW15_16870 [Nitrospirota bacterium]|nr:hypothetical protein [Nitrospirota bacterium]
MDLPEKASMGSVWFFPDNGTLRDISELPYLLTCDAEQLIMRTMPGWEEAHAFFLFMIDTRMLMRDLGGVLWVGHASARLDNAGSSNCADRSM